MIAQHPAPPPENPPVAPPMSREETAACIHQSLLALAAHAADLAERLDRETRAAALSFLPLAWLLAGRSFCRRRRLRCCRRLLIALAEIFAPRSAEIVPGPTLPAPTLPPIAEAQAHRFHPAARPKNTCAEKIRPLVRRNQPPNRRLLPPPQAAPRAAPRPRAA